MGISAANSARPGCAVSTWRELAISARSSASPTRPRSFRRCRISPRPRCARRSQRGSVPYRVSVASTPMAKQSFALPRLSWRRSLAGARGKRGHRTPPRRCARSPTSRRGSTSAARSPRCPRHSRRPRSPQSLRAVLCGEARAACPRPCARQRQGSEVQRGGGASGAGLMRSTARWREAHPTADPSGRCRMGALGVHGRRRAAGAHLGMACPIHGRATRSSPGAAARSWRWRKSRLLHACFRRPR
mmetsp:Transcript_65667/g.189328  ORF Transcript_65667/g.189328 Transcript_65667/m.189328 type:complete len:245 (+) Transcript_65667:141-875(+)